MANPNKYFEEKTGGIHCAAVSDVGMRRASNQDSFAIALADSKTKWQKHGHLLMVADGMGAHAAGELASKMATDTIPLTYEKRAETSPRQAIDEAVREANRVIHNKGQNSVDFEGMGTTCSCLLLLPSGAMVAHVGDSRIYRLRGEMLEQLTFDHSLVWEMAAAGQSSEDEVPAYVPKNVITRSLGPHSSVAVDLEGPFLLETGDRFLLCSDGLTGPLQPGLIGMILGALSVDEAARTLVDLANLLGGPDNISVVVAEIVDAEKLGDKHYEQTLHPPDRLSPPPPAPKLSWSYLAAGVSALGTLAFALIDQMLLATVCGTLLVLLLAWIVYRKKLGPHAVRRANTESNLQGKAPYRIHQCGPNAESIGKLSDIVRQLEDLENQRDWDFDWQRIRSEREKAHAAVAQGNFQQAVVSFCHAIRLLMESLRKGTPPPPSDSTIDLG